MHEWAIFFPWDRPRVINATLFVPINRAVILHAAFIIHIAGTRCNAELLRWNVDRRVLQHFVKQSIKLYDLGATEL